MVGWHQEWILSEPAFDACSSVIFSIQSSSVTARSCESEKSLLSASLIRPVDLEYTSTLGELGDDAKWKVSEISLCTVGRGKTYTNYHYHEGILCIIQFSSYTTNHGLHIMNWANFLVKHQSVRLRYENRSIYLFKKFWNSRISN